MDPAIIELITRTMAIANFCASTPVNCTERKSRVESVINRLIVLSTEMIMMIVGIRCLLSNFLIYIGTDSHCCYCVRSMIESMGVRMPVLYPEGNPISSHGPLCTSTCSERESSLRWLLLIKVLRSQEPALHL